MSEPIDKRTEPTINLDYPVLNDIVVTAKDLKNTTTTQENIQQIVDETKINIDAALNQMTLKIIAALNEAQTPLADDHDSADKDISDENATHDDTGEKTD